MGATAPRAVVPAGAVPTSASLMGWCCPYGRYLRQQASPLWTLPTSIPSLPLLARKRPRLLAATLVVGGCACWQPPLQATLVAWSWPATPVDGLAMVGRPSLLRSLRKRKRGRRIGGGGQSCILSTMNLPPIY
ncbi:hypothetical protein B296_00004547, partial [Ensete ventricosum]